VWFFNRPNVNPHHEGPRCTRYAPSVKCGAREDAQRDGSMFYSDKYAGWVYPGEDRQPPRILRAKWQAPFTWTFCPFCSGALPDIGDVVDRILRPDNGEGEE
jgi:hypothetical protein